jgi:hypothetical protein
MRKQWLRLLRIAPLALLCASVAFAQTTGTIIGVVTDASTNNPVAGALVIATSPNLQGEQTAVTDNAGNFRITQLPSGAYRLSVQLEGFNPAERSDIVVGPDRTLRANLAVVPSSVEMEEQVVRTGVAPVINVGTAESGTVVSKEFMANVPVGRGFENIAVVAPTAKNDLYGVSFAGAQSPENQYIVDGLNTTDPAYGTRGGLGNIEGPPSLRSNFLQEVDIKTGGYSAEYGRATGGILNVILKGGSNEYHGSIFSSFTPSFLVEPNGQVTGSSGQAIGYQTNPGEGTYGLDLGFEVGGPIMKDKLWFYGGFSPIYQRTYYERFLRRNVLASDAGGCPVGYSENADGQCQSDTTGDYAQTRIAGSERILNTSRDTYQWVGKLTYLLNADNTFTVSGWGAPSEREALQQGFIGGAMYNSESARFADQEENQTALLGRWAGKFFSRKLLSEVQVGWFASSATPTGRTVGGINTETTPRIEFNSTQPITAFEDAPGCTDDIDCPVTGYSAGGRGGLFERSTDRYVGKASLSYLFNALGIHNLKGGVDLERVQYEIDKTYTGGTYFLYQNTSIGGVQTPVFRAFRGFGSINAPADESGAASTDDPALVSQIAPSTTSETDSFGYFLQDSWQVIPSLTLNYGLRLETQTMKNLDFPDATGFDIKDNWSPRVQAVWDFTGNGRGKLAATWGRFYYAMPLDMGDRAFGFESSLTYFLDATTCGAGDPAAAARIDPSQLNFQGSGCAVADRAGANYQLTGGTLTPADPDLKGSFIDQFGGGIEYEVLPDLALGIEYTGRRQGNVIEDLSSNDGTTYFIGNPGRDRSFSDPNLTDDDTTPDVDESLVSTKFTDTVDPLTGRTVRIEFPEPERSYDAMTLKATKNFSKNWLAQVSYTYSYLRGNYPGPFRPESGQLDPGITSEYDLASLMANRTGFLPGDVPHQIKLFGAYNFPLTTKFNVTTSMVYNGASGTPVNALGGHPVYGPSEAFMIPRGMGGRTPFLNTFDVGAAAEYVIRAPYAVNFRVDLFNVFNRQAIREIDEDYTFDDVAPIPVSCDSRNSAGKANPVAALQADCPDLAYLRTVDGRPVTVNPNWGKAARTTTAFQNPLSLRLSLALTF